MDGPLVQVSGSIRWRQLELKGLFESFNNDLPCYTPTKALSRTRSWNLTLERSIFTFVIQLQFTFPKVDMSFYCSLRETWKALLFLKIKIQYTCKNYILNWITKLLFFNVQKIIKPTHFQSYVPNTSVDFFKIKKKYFILIHAKDTFKMEEKQVKNESYNQLPYWFSNPEKNRLSASQWVDSVESARIEMNWNDSTTIIHVIHALRNRALTWFLTLVWDSFLFLNHFWFNAMIHLSTF